MNSNTTIFILGAGTMQIPAIRIAREKGWRVAVADGNNNAPGRSLADVFYHIDLKDREALIEAARELRESGLDGVFTAGTDFSTSVAAVAKSLGLPGISPEAAERAKHKIRMRECFRKAGVPSPDFYLVRNERECTAAAKGLSFPLVIKPVDNMGARGVRRVDTMDELIEPFREALGCSFSGEVILEEYIPGPEFSLDALVYRGEVDICGFADRHIRFSPFFVEMGHTMPTDLSEKEKQSVAGCFQKGIRALGIDNGAAKGDVKLTPSGPVIGEIAARLSGGYMSGWTYPYASGHDVTASALDIAAGRPPSGRHRGYPRWSAERAFISIPGRVLAIEGMKEAAGDSRVKDLFIRTSPGEETRFPRNNVEKCGNVISMAGSRAEAVEAAEKAAGTVFIRLESGNPGTEAFLFAPPGNWPPPAFRLSSADNISAFSGMPDFKTPNGGLPVLILPDIDSENEKEWHGISLAEAFQRAAGGYGPGTLIPGKPFWRALLRGGVQGGRWVMDTLRAAEQQGRDPREVIGRWNEIGED